MKGFCRLILRALSNRKSFELCREINTTYRLAPRRFIHVSSATTTFWHSSGGAFSNSKTVASSLYPEKLTFLTGCSIMIEIIVIFCYFTSRFEFLCSMLISVLRYVKGPFFILIMLL